MNNNTIQPLAQFSGAVAFFKSFMLNYNLATALLFEIEFETLGNAIISAGLFETLAGPGPFTVFAPSSQALLNANVTVQQLLTNPTALSQFLLYHVVPGSIQSQSVQPGSVETANGASLSVNVDAQGVLVNNARVLLADLNVQNGVIHIIDQVLVPP